ncbi:MAG: hypothetical protein JW719_11035 [Pirellulales bacterium]|nr:hypothetical protein [Pirellulales bacterium]
MIIKASNSEKQAYATVAELAELTAGMAVDAVENSLRAEAARIVAEAKHESERLRREAVAEGRHEGEQAAREEAARRRADRWATAMPAVEQLAEELLQAKQAWLAHWEKAAVGLAAAIARRVLRRELARHPDVAVDLVREALELAAGSQHVRVMLSPVDHRALGPRIAELAERLGRLGTVEVVADAATSPGGCRVETRFGVIDQQFETQLARIEEELS